MQNSRGVGGGLSVALESLFIYESIRSLFREHFRWKKLANANTFSELLI